ncbi:MAG TPA: isoleucine--tRNA ligase [Planctomycetota bacterium]|nr:isoleucine--tRNA ligase [Planctomycetota bacterium]
MAEKSYKDTLNLPKTDFPMAANLTQMEPRIREKWEKEKLYERIQAARKGAPLWVLHDGPPYANGDVHVGTGQNKVLKDIVVKFRTMQGFASPYVPGWDCHGLPIEHKVVKELGPKARDMSKADIRKLCLEFARRYIDIQRRQFKSLGVLGDWDHPYLTIDPQYELGIIEVFELLWQKGHIAKRSRPIHWCIHDRTALAEAELEYRSEKSPSIYLAFEMTTRPRTELLVWTTTPWTIPADVAVAVHPGLDYAICKFREGEAIIAPQRLEEARKRFPIGEQVGTIKGRDLEGQKYKHPLYGHECPVVLADYVTTTDGTGLVHTAPGHGAEDYETGLKYKLPVLSPVDEGGLFTAEAPGFTGKQVFAANPDVIEALQKLGRLCSSEEFAHDYPCCWRCKKPVIFRATEQWFILIDHDRARQKALEAIQKTRWVPAWGETRIRSMVEGRPDWCVSRQRSWGVPIPAFYCARCRKLYFNQASFDAVKALFSRGGADLWFTTEAKDILPAGTRCECGSTEFTKESDIFDVWFESGASHRSVLMKRSELHFPAELYLEGTDQHRGWFQVSLLASLLSNGQAPFKEVVTHGFLVDARTGDKLSKSGFLIAVDEVVAKIGAELLRLWIAGIDFTDDLPMSWEILKERAEPYKKIRNSIRYLLGMTWDFDPAKDRVGELVDVDRWALAELSGLVKRVTQHYENYQFFRAYQELYQFCVVEMSSIYFDVTKDRLYTSGKASPERRSGQTAMHEILVALVKMLAPMLCHTAEEVWGYLPGREADSVHLARWPQAGTAQKDPKWDRILRVRTEVQRELEKLRAAGTIGKSLEAKVLLHAADPELDRALRSTDLAAILIVSEVELAGSPVGPASPEVQGLSLKAEKATSPKCERCWNLRKDVGAHPAHPGLCGRCVAALR